LEPECIVCGSDAELRETKHYFLKLTAFEEFLRRFLEEMGGTDIARNYAKKWLEGGLKDWNITRSLDWGVKFPGEEDLVLYVWFDAPIGYISSTEEWSQRTGVDWQYYWKGPGKLVHFIGGDIVYHHCLFWPSMLYGSDYSVPDAVVASGMVRVSGHVFSKSRGYVIWVDEDYLINELDPDALRYYVASYTGHTRDLDFSWITYGEKVNKELVGTLGNFIYRTLLFAHRNYGKVPEGELDSELHEQIIETINVIRNGLDEYEFKKISDAVLGIASYGNRYIQHKAPWRLIKERPEEAAKVVYNSLWLVKAIAVLVEPLMPEKAKEIWMQLGEKPRTNVPLDEATKSLRVGKEIPKPEILFNQIPEEEIDALNEAMLMRISEVKK
jgi:methionyl-tRNA synthetase